MTRWEKPVLLNTVVFAALLLYDLATNAYTNDGLFGRFASIGMMLLLLAPVNFVIGLVRWRKGDGPAYLIISGLLLLIGFSVCTIP